jgi:predicted YcjX-like family ATPase
MVPGLNSVTAGLRDLAAQALGDERIGLAVTGLSRAGKTVLVTSLIQNLLALGQGLDTLPAFAACLRGDGGSRLVSVEVMPAGAAALPHFDQKAKLEALAGARPAWPARTEDLATISLLLTIARPSALGRHLGPRRVRLDILDYPGEWLLDLPLLSQGFNAWSRETLALLRTEPRRSVAAPFLQFLERQGGPAPADEGLARQGHALYKATLERCRTERGLRFLQPGRFLCPGPRGDVPYMWFYPDDSERGGMVALLTERFEAYQRAVRGEFFEPHFAAFHRQVMLVDVLGALVAGQAAFEDTARAIRAIAAALRYGDQGGLVAASAAWMLRGMGHVLPPVLGGLTNAAARQIADPRIERVAVVATKADHVPALKRDNLRHLLRAMADPVAADQGQAGAGVSYHVAAGLLSTEDGVARLDGRTVPVVQGIVLGEDKLRPYFVGEVPSGMPLPDFWSEAYFELPVFRPPQVDGSGRTGLPHLGLDAVLADLIGDLVA